MQRSRESGFRVGAVAAVGVLVAVLIALLVPAVAGTLSKSYVFRSDVTLEIGDVTDDGMRLDSITFRVPRSAGEGSTRTRGPVEASVAVSNTSEKSRRVGLAISLHGPDGELLGVASGGTRIAPLKPGRQRTYRLPFDHVNASAGSADTFRVTLESGR